MMREDISQKYALIVKIKDDLKSKNYGNNKFADLVKEFAEHLINLLTVTREFLRLYFPVPDKTDDEQRIGERCC